MDAKPQKPTRTLRVFGDENAMPAIGVSKTIHQRNKSSPALSTMHAAGGLKLAAKRTAFGDVSNTANVLRPSRDDSAIGAKGEFAIPEKPLHTQEERKPTAFLRPAQRPMSVSGLKGLLNGVISTTNQLPVKQPSVDLQQPSQSISQVANIRKVATKRSTIVLNDPPMKAEKSPPNISRTSTSNAPLAPVHRELLPRQQSRIQEDLQEIEPKLSHDQDKPTKDQSQELDCREHAVARPLPPISSAEPAISRSDGLYIDEQGEVQSYDYIDPIKLSQVIPEEKEPLAGQEMPYQVKTTALNGNCEVSFPKPQAPPIKKSTLAPVSEPEEYWDDEGEENCDEDGYVTARSFKSRGDNTTGGATTVLFPKVTQKAKKEIAIAKDLIEGSKTVEELEDEAWDTTMVAEYGDEIFQYMKDLEVKMLPNAHYMDNQAEIQWSMRAVLMDWIVQVHHRFNLLPETLFLCVNYIDRFLSCKVVSLGKLQLVGATAIFIAAKYEEIDCPSVQEIVYMVDGGYTIDEILKAERFMLSMLQFELGWPGPMSFLRRISKADDYDLETRTLAKYFLEITIMDERFVGSPPSFVAAGAHCLARMMLKKGAWSVAHVYYSNYTYSQLFNLVLLMVECCEDARKHHCAVYDKYTDKRYKRASHFAESEMKRGFQIMDVNSHAAPASYPTLYDDRQIWGHK